MMHVTGAAARAGRLVGRLGRDRSGASAIEFALVAPIFIALLFAILETGLVFLASQTLETATADAARLVMTGQAQNMTAEQFKTKTCEFIPALFDCSKISVDVRAFDAVPTIPPAIVDGHFTNNVTFNAGKRSQTVVVRLFYEWPLVVTGIGYNVSNIAGNKRLLTATAAFRNEPF